MKPIVPHETPPFVTHLLQYLILPQRRDVGIVLNAQQFLLDSGISSLFFDSFLLWHLDLKL